VKASKAAYYAANRERIAANRKARKLSPPGSSGGLSKCAKPTPQDTPGDLQA
jgi:hypothetical protein